MATYTAEGILIPEIPTVTGPVSPNATPDTAANDLPSFTVTAPPLLQAGLADWLKPPKVYLLVAVAGIGYYLFSKRER